MTRAAEPGPPSTQAETSSSSESRPLIAFLVAALLTATVVCTAGWFSGFRGVMHGALLGVAVFAFLPLVLVVAGIAIAMLCIMVSLVAALLGDGGGDVLATDGGLVEVGVRVTPGYYRFMAARFVARRKHPVFWGVPTGALAGGLVLWAVLGVRVIPGETRSVQTIADIQARVDAAYERTSRYPAPTPDGHLTYESLKDGGPGAGIVLDGFGRPLTYRKAGHWKLASYVLRSHGYDGKPGGGDDLCASGATKLSRLAQHVSLRRGDGGKGVSLSMKLGAVRDARCDE